MKRMLRKGLERELPEGYDIDAHFSPRYDPWDQRLCAVPDGDLFTAISSGAASVVTDRIDRFTETGLRLESGDELEADVIVTATGLEVLFLGDIEVSVDGEVVDLPGRLAYKGMMLEGVPNLALAFGYTNASWTLKADLTCDYVCRLLNLMRTRGLARCTPRNRDGAVPLGSMLGLSSGYVQRSVDRLPKQGSRAPWQVHQSYLRDWRIVKRGALEDESLELTRRPARVEART
jgi:cation diffusion facilitator CzcD-associated flavoprotein CzcO